MGKLITFWSPVRGQAKVTSTMCALVSAMALQNPQLEIALGHTRVGNTDLEDCLDVKMGSGRKKEFYERTGLAALIVSYKQEELYSEKIRRCAIPLLLGNVQLFPGVGKEFWLVQGNDLLDLKYHILTRKLAEEYEVICLDLEDGMNENSFRYMMAADVVVIVLPQNPGIWDRYLSECKTRLAGKKVYYVLGGYSKDSRYGMTQLMVKIQKLNGCIGVVPWNVGFMDALAEGRTMEFFLKNQNVGKKEPSYEFMEQTRKTAEQIRRRTENL